MRKELGFLGGLAALMLFLVLGGGRLVVSALNWGANQVTPAIADSISGPVG